MYDKCSDFIKYYLINPIENIYLVIENNLYIWTIGRMKMLWYKKIILYPLGK